MMKSRSVAVAVILAVALVPAAPAWAWGQRDGGFNRGHHGGDPIRGLAGAVVGAAAAVISVPFVILTAIAQGPRYAVGPNYIGAAPAYLAPPAGPAYYGPPPDYNRTPPDLRYDAPATAYYPAQASAYQAPAYQAPAYYPPPQAPIYYAPPAAAQYYAPRQAYYVPRQAYYAPRYYLPPPADNGYYRR